MNRGAEKEAKMSEKKRGVGLPSTGKSHLFNQICGFSNP